MNTTLVLYQKMQSEDYTAVIQTAVRECDVKSEDRAAELLDAFLQWFALIPLTKDAEPLQMLRSVDRIWHAFVLNTAFYRNFCDKYIGHFVDHDPLDVVNNIAAKDVYAQHTIALIENAYGAKANIELFRLREDVTCCCGCIEAEPLRLAA